MASGAAKERKKRRAYVQLWLVKTIVGSLMGVYITVKGITDGAWEGIAIGAVLLLFCPWGAVAYYRDLKQLKVEERAWADPRMGLNQRDDVQ